MTYAITTQRHLRDQFWADHPQFKRRAKWTQNQYPTDVRVAFCSYVDHLSRDGQISDHLAQQATL